MHDWKEIRRWANDTGISCPATGRLPGRIIAAYTTAHPDTVIADLPEPVKQTPIDEPEFFSATLEVPGAAADEVAELERLVLDVVMAAYASGRAAERRDMFTRLRVES